jgi:hypothetical protein
MVFADDQLIVGQKGIVTTNVDQHRGGRRAKTRIKIG